MGHTIRCPSCRHEFELSAVMRAELETEVRAGVARQFDAELTEARRQLAAAATREADLLKQQRQVAERQQQLELEVERRVHEETAHIREREASAARERFAREADERVRANQQELAETQAKLAAAASREAELLKKQRELADKERELALHTERRVAEEVAKAREEDARRAREREEIAQQQQRLRSEEYEQTIAGMRKHIAELQRKAEQGSQQLQGEAQEVVLRDLLAGAFPLDAIEDVPKGVSGADLVQRVRGVDGREGGAIVWESKRTKTWSDGWLPKLRDDQREAGAACAVIVTQVLPADVRSFGQKEGVWVCAPVFAVPLAAALRAGLVEVALAKRAAEGSGQKMQLLYDYLTGTEFRNRIEGLVEAFVDMQDELAAEKRATLTRWKRREKMIDRALENITAFCGDLQGIAGRQLGDLLPEALESAKALPEAIAEEEGEGEGEDHAAGGAAGPGGADDERLKELLFELLPADGSMVGNGTLSEAFVERALTQIGVRARDRDYERCKEALLADGRIRRGKGRGGSVGRVVAAAAAE